MKTRVLAALCLLPLLLVVVLVAPKFVTAIMFALISAIGAYELLIGTGVVQHKRLVAYSIVMAVLVSLNSYFSVDALWLQIGVIVFWILLFAEMMHSRMTLRFEKVFVCFAAGVVIPFLLTALVRIHKEQYGRYLILVPFVQAFLSDTGAYFAGRAFGKHKLAPVISPKKTIEGVAGGVVGAVIGMIVYCVVLQFCFGFEVNYVLAAVYGLIGSVAAVFGDLCFSVIKRQTGIKDYGNLIPGHGGVLDRFDSMIVVAPVTEVLLILLPLAVRV